jgi:hypothetical protein
VHEHWPEGPDARSWRRLLTEVQMRWHDSPVNAAREARAQRAVNALWLHGGGAWTALPVRPFAAVAGDDPVLRGWALASGLPRAALLGAAAAARGDAVSLRRDLLAAAQAQAWGQWLDRLAGLDAALRALQADWFAAGGDEIALVLCGRRRVRIARLRRGDAWRLWRRASPALLAEAE